MTAVAIDLARYQALPFRERGRSAAGVDCWGLVWLIYGEALGLRLPTYREAYAGLKGRANRLAVAELVAVERRLAQTALSGWNELAGADLEAGPKALDLVVFEGAGTRHVGLCLGDLYHKPRHFLHIEDESGVHISDLERQADWGARPRSFYRHALAPANVTLVRS